MTSETDWICGWIYGLFKKERENQSKMWEKQLKINDGICKYIFKPAENMREFDEDVFKAIFGERVEEMNDLKDTEKLMESKNYKDRLIAEYWQTKIRYERLKKLNTQIEAVKKYNEDRFYVDDQREEPEHESPADLLKRQQNIMGEYLHILEVRAEIEHIELEVGA